MSNIEYIKDTIKQSISASNSYMSRSQDQIDTINTFVDVLRNRQYFEFLIQDFDENLSSDQLTFDYLTNTIKNVSGTDQELVTNKIQEDFSKWGIKLSFSSIPTGTTMFYSTDDVNYTQINPENIDRYLNDSTGVRFKLILPDTTEIKRLVVGFEL